MSTDLAAPPPAEVNPLDTFADGGSRFPNLGVRDLLRRFGVREDARLSDDVMRLLYMRIDEKSMDAARIQSLLPVGDARALSENVVRARFVCMYLLSILAEHKKTLDQMGALKTLATIATHVRRPPARDAEATFARHASHLLWLADKVAASDARLAKLYNGQAMAVAAATKRRGFTRTIGEDGFTEEAQQLFEEYLKDHRLDYTLRRNVGVQLTIVQHAVRFFFDPVYGPKDQRVVLLFRPGLGKSICVLLIVAAYVRHFRAQGKRKKILVGSASDALIKNLRHEHETMWKALDFDEDMLTDVVFLDFRYRSAVPYKDDPLAGFGIEHPDVNRILQDEEGVVVLDEYHNISGLPKKLAVDRRGSKNEGFIRNVSDFRERVLKSKCRVLAGLTGTSFRGEMKGLTELGLDLGRVVAGNAQANVAELRGRFMVAMLFGMTGEAFPELRPAISETARLESAVPWNQWSPFLSSTLLTVPASPSEMASLSPSGAIVANEKLKVGDRKRETPLTMFENNKSCNMTMIPRAASLTEGNESYEKLLADIKQHPFVLVPKLAAAADTILKLHTTENVILRPGVRVVIRQFFPPNDAFSEALVKCELLQEETQPIFASTKELDDIQKVIFERRIASRFVTIEMKDGTRHTQVRISHIPEENTVFYEPGKEVALDKTSVVTLRQNQSMQKFAFANKRTFFRGTTMSVDRAVLDADAALPEGERAMDVFVNATFEAPLRGKVPAYLRVRVGEKTFLIRNDGKHSSPMKQMVMLHAHHGFPVFRHVLESVRRMKYDDVLSQEELAAGTIEITRQPPRQDAKWFDERFNQKTSTPWLAIVNGTYFGEGLDVHGYVGISYAHMLSFTYDEAPRRAADDEEDGPRTGSVLADIQERLRTARLFRFRVGRQTVFLRYAMLDNDTAIGACDVDAITKLQSGLRDMFGDSEEGVMSSYAKVDVFGGELQRRIEASVNQMTNQASFFTTTFRVNTRAIDDERFAAAMAWLSTLVSVCEQQTKATRETSCAAHAAAECPVFACSLNGSSWCMPRVEGSMCDDLGAHIARFSEWTRRLSLRTVLSFLKSDELRDAYAHFTRRTPLAPLGALFVRRVFMVGSEQRYAPRFMFDRVTDAHRALAATLAERALNDVAPLGGNMEDAAACACAALLAQVLTDATFGFADDERRLLRSLPLLHVQTLKHLFSVGTHANENVYLVNQKLNDTWNATPTQGDTLTYLYETLREKNRGVFRFATHPLQLLGVFLTIQFVSVLEGLKSEIVYDVLS